MNTRVRDNTGGKYNDRARRLYERNGFRATGEKVRERDGLIEIEMRHE